VNRRGSRAWLNEMPVKKDKIGKVKSFIMVPRLKQHNGE
jgi:hypothetical protein